MQAQIVRVPAAKTSTSTVGKQQKKKCTLSVPSLRTRESLFRQRHPHFETGLAQRHHHSLGGMPIPRHPPHGILVVRINHSRSHNVSEGDQKGEKRNKSPSIMDPTQ